MDPIEMEPPPVMLPMHPENPVMLIVPAIPVLFRNRRRVELPLSDMVYRYVTKADIKTLLPVHTVHGKETVPIRPAG
jgi:hypothetical protein